MMKEDLLWDNPYEGCYLLWAMVNGNYLGMGYVLDMEDGTWYYKGDSGLGDIVYGSTNSIEEAFDIVISNVDLTSY